MFSRQQLKHDAKSVMKEGKFKLKWKVLMFLLLSITISQLVFIISGYNDYANRLTNSANSALEVLEEVGTTNDPTAYERFEEAFDDYEDALENYPRISPVASLISFLLLIMSPILTAGFEWWCLLNIRRKPNDFKSMFDGFGFMFKLILLMFLSGLITLIGCMFFIIPGIILALGFSQALYILFEDPKQGVIQCLLKSTKMMSGHKAEYFVLELSFIGWIFVGLLISGYISAIFTVAGLSALTAYSTVFFNIWLTPYMGLTRAGFYNQISNHTASYEIQPIEEDNTL